MHSQSTQCTHHTTVLPRPYIAPQLSKHSQHSHPPPMGCTPQSPQCARRPSAQAPHCPTAQQRTRAAGTRRPLRWAPATGAVGGGACRPPGGAATSDSGCWSAGSIRWMLSLCQPCGSNANKGCKRGNYLMGRAQTSLSGQACWKDMPCHAASVANSCLADAMMLMQQMGTCAVATTATFFCWGHSHHNRRTRCGCAPVADTFSSAPSTYNFTTK